METQEDDSDAAWAHQQELEQRMLDDDDGYVDWLLTVAISHSIQLGD